MLVKTLTSFRRRFQRAWVRLTPLYPSVRLGERRVDVIELQKLAQIYDKSIAYFLGEE
jgi:hypothetical protein